MALFKKNKIYAFGDGEIVALKDIPDAAFASGALGDGLGIELSNNEVVSPVDGEVTMIFPTNHALGIKTNDGLELLIHVGVDTVSLNGEGFSGHVTNGTKVKKGDKLITADLEFIKSKNIPTVAIFVVTDAQGKKLSITSDKTAVKGDTTIITY